MEKYTIVKNYRNNPKLRKSFNKLAKATFDFDFEDWYQNGYWGDCYIPYSVVIEDEVIANVSVNIMDFLEVRNGQSEQNVQGERNVYGGTGADRGYDIKHYIQLGTVMTRDSYRNRGFIREIMTEIEKDYGKQADGIFLFANDSVLDFYPKFGFRKGTEYQYEKEVTISGERTIEQITMKEKQEWEILEKAIEKSIPCGCFELVHKKELVMFYVTKFMQENVYYHREQDAYMIAEEEGGCLLLHAVFSENPIQLDRLIDAFGREIRQVKFGFTPKNICGCHVSWFQEEDTTLFLKGDGFPVFEKEKLMFPTLAHA